MKHRISQEDRMDDFSKDEVTIKVTEEEPDTFAMGSDGYLTWCNTSSDPC